MDSFFNFQFDNSLCRDLYGREIVRLNGKVGHGDKFLEKGSVGKTPPWRGFPGYRIMSDESFSYHREIMDKSAFPAIFEVRYEDPHSIVRVCLDFLVE